MYDRRCLKTWSLITIGSAVMAFGVYNFYYINNITEGGILGLLLLFKNLFNINPSITSAVLDIGLLLLGCKFFGKRFFKYSIIAAVMFAVLYDVFADMGPMVPQMGILPAAIFGGLSVGIGCGMVVKAGCASGGDDALAMMVSEKTPLKIGTVYFLMDAIVLLLSLSYLSTTDIMYSFVAISISGKVIDMIYSSNSEETAEEEEVTSTTAVVSPIVEGSYSEEASLGFAKQLITYIVNCFKREIYNNKVDFYKEYKYNGRLNNYGIYNSYLIALGDG